MRIASPKIKASPARIAGVDNRTLEDLADIFRSLSDRSRLLILMLLAREGEMHVSAICKRIGHSQPAVSHHLTQLRSAGLINYRRDGKFNNYSIDSALAEQILRNFFPGVDSAQQKFTFGELELLFKSK